MSKIDRVRSLEFKAFAVSLGALIFLSMAVAQETWEATLGAHIIPGGESSGYAGFRIEKDEGEFSGKLTFDDGYVGFDT